MSVYADDGLVQRMTAALVADGYSIFQIHKIGDSDREHVAALLALFDPPEGAAVLDIGCGVGRVAELMAAARPDLEFTLLNISPAQLEMCPAGFAKLTGGMEAIPAHDASFNAVMFCYSLGHGELEPTIAEAARVLRPGGVLFIYDLEAEEGARLADVLDYRAHARGLVEAAGRRHVGPGGSIALPPTNADRFVELATAEVFSEVFADVRPAAYRFVRRYGMQSQYC